MFRKTKKIYTNKIPSGLLSNLKTRHEYLAEAGELMEILDKLMEEHREEVDEGKRIPEIDEKLCRASELVLLVEVLEGMEGKM